MKNNETPSQQKLEATPTHEFILGSLFMVSNQLQTLLDREFEPQGMTAKQWFLSVIIGGAFDEPPTLGEAAAAMGSTHQNVKQVALKLKEKGYLEIANDAADGRAVRLRLTQKSEEFWMSMQRRSEEFMASMYSGLTEEELSVFRMALGKLMGNLREMNRASKSKEESNQ